MRKSLLILLLLICLSSISISDEQDSNEVVSYTASTKTVCDGNLCTKTLYSGAMFMQDENDEFGPYTEVTKLLFENGKLKIKWNDTEQLDNEIDLETVIFSDDEQFEPVDFPNMSYSIDIEDKEFNYKFNLSFNLPANDTVIGLDINTDYDYSLGATYVEIGKHTIDFSDAISENYSVSIGTYVNQQAKEVIRINITKNWTEQVGDRIVIDPMITLQDSGTENLEDSYIDEINPTDQFGSSSFLFINGQEPGNFLKFALIKFNISELSGVTVQNATLNLWQEIERLDSGEVITGAVHHLFNQTWSENVTWDTRPQDFNNTNESNIVFNDGEPDQWRVWNITSMLNKEIDNSNTNFSIQIRSSLISGSPGNSDDVGFSSRDDSDSSLRPFLNVTYTEPTPPTYNTFESNATSDSKFGDTVNFTVNLLDNKGLNVYKFAHNASGSLTNVTTEIISTDLWSASYGLDLTLTVNEVICGEFWFNDTSGNENTTNSTCFTVGNSLPTLDTDLTFLNYSTTHAFNISATFTDLDTFTDFGNHTVEVTAGTCDYISNSTAGNDITVKYSCSGTALEDATVRMNVSDSSGIVINSSELVNTYPNNLPTLTTLDLNKTSGVVDGDDLNCTIEGVADLDGDTISYFYEWYNGAVAQNLNSENLSNTITSAGENWNCEGWVGDTYENSTKQTSSVVTIDADAVAPYINSTNATTANTGINSTSSNPTNNNSWINFSVTFDDVDDEEWTMYICDTSNFNDCQTNSSGEIYCKSDDNVTQKTMTCDYNVTTISAVGAQTYYSFIVDNTSKSSSAFSATFEINYPPSTPTLVEPADLASITMNYTVINYTSTDVDSDTVNISIYNSSDNITFSLLNNSAEPFNWTGLEDGIHYIKAAAIDSHGYNSFQNTSITFFTIDHNAPNINTQSVSSSSVTTAGTVTFSVNATDTVGIDATACILTLRKSDYNGGEGVGNPWNETTNSKSNDVVSFSLSMSALGTGTLEWQHSHCQDTNSNLRDNRSVGLNVTISAVSTPPATGGGGSSGTIEECNDAEDCLVFGLGFECVANKCVKQDREDEAAANLLSRDLPIEIVEELVLAAGGVCNWDNVCEVSLGENRFNCGDESILIDGITTIVEGDCGLAEFNLPVGFLTTAGIILIAIVLVLFISARRRK